MDAASNTPLYFVALAGYVLLLGGVGYCFSRLNRNTQDYFRNGSKTCWWVAGASIFMNSFSAFTFTGAAGVAFEAGWSAAASFFGGALALVLCAFFLGAWFRQMRVTTFPEALSLRFGEKTRLIFAVVTVLTQTAYAALFLYSLSLFVSVIFQFPLGATILILGLSVTIYTTMGGCWAATAGDFIQAALLIPVTTLLAILCFLKLGGFSGFLGGIESAGLRENYAFMKSTALFSNGAYSWTWTIAIMLMTFISGTSLMSGVRFFTVKDARHASKASLLALGLLLFGVTVWFIPPIAGRLLYSGEILGQALAHPADSAYAITGLLLLPPALSALLLLGMFSATVSSLDTGLNRNVAIVICDLYPAVCRRMGWRVRTPSELLRPSRFLALLSGAIIMSLASYMAGLKGMGILELMIRVGAMLGIPMALPLLLCLFVRSAPPWAAVASMLGGLLCGFVCSRYGLNSQTTTFSVVAVSGLVFGLSMLFPRKKESAYAGRVDAFFSRMKTPVDFEGEIGGDVDRSQFIILGGAVFALALLTTGIALMSGEGLALSLGVAAFYLLLGAVLGVFAWKGRFANIRESETAKAPQPIGESARPGEEGI